MRADLDAADHRNLKLVREVDDRHANMEILNQSRLRLESERGPGQPYWDPLKKLVFFKSRFHFIHISWIAKKVTWLKPKGFFFL